MEFVLESHGRLQLTVSRIQLPGGGWTGIPSLVSEAELGKAWRGSSSAPPPASTQTSPVTYLCKLSMVKVGRPHPYIYA